MLAGASSTKALQGALTTSFSQWLINRRPRTSITNLFKRAQDMLERDFLRAVGRMGRGRPATVDGIRHASLATERIELASS